MAGADTWARAGAGPPTTARAVAGYVPGARAPGSSRRGSIVRCAGRPGWDGTNIPLAAEAPRGTVRAHGMAGRPGQVGGPPDRAASGSRPLARAAVPRLWPSWASRPALAQNPGHAGRDAGAGDHGRADRRAHGPAPSAACTASSKGEANMPIINASSLATGNLEGALLGAISLIFDHSEPGVGPRLHRHPYDET